jgi:hypothetical protein
MLNVATIGCANVIATIDRAPEWAQAVPESPRGPIKSTELNRFKAFVVALVERYDGDGQNDAPSGAVVNYWEFYNEPDLGSTVLDGSGWGNYGSQYAAMLQTVHDPIKAANPNAQIVMGGIAHDAFVDKGGPFIRSFLDDVLTAGGGSSFDIMNFHYYPAFSVDYTQANGTGLPEKTAAIRQKLAEYQVSKPIVVTEVGWHSDQVPEEGCGEGDKPRCPELPSSEEDQSRYVVQFFAQSIAFDIDFSIWWVLYDLADYAFDNGLVTQAGVTLGGPLAKPSYRAYQTAVRRIERATFVAALNIAETRDANLEVYQFTEAYTGKRMFVAWVNPVDTNETRPLNVAGSMATLYSKENVLQGVVRDGDDGMQDGQLTVHIGGSPIYVIMD